MLNGAYAPNLSQLAREDSFRPQDRLSSDQRCFRGRRNDSGGPLVDSPARSRRGRCVLERIMAPRANWKGYLKLSLVSCAVELYPSSTTKDRVTFNMVNREPEAGFAASSSTRLRATSSRATS